MKIAFYTDTYLPNRDGVVTSIVSFRRELEAQGHKVFVFASGSQTAKKENTDPDVFYHASTPFKPYPQYRIALFPFLSQSRLRPMKVDVVHSHGMATMGLAAEVAAHSLGVPHVGTLHTLIPKATHYVSGGVRQVKNAAESLAWEYLKWYYNRCDVATAPSGVIKGMMEEHGIRDVRVIPNGVDVIKLNPKRKGRVIRRKWGLEGKKVVLHLGRLVLEKNLDVLINSALFVLEEEPNVRFLIVGTGPASSRYKEIVRRRGVEKYFVFTGFVEDYLIPEVYACANAVTIPSKFETQGLVTLEAMACGKPVAGADYLATKEIIKDKVNGYLFNPDDPEDCARSVVKALNAPRMIKQNARITAEEYSVQACTNRLIKLYEEFI